MPPTLDVGSAIGAFLVTDRQVQNLEVRLGCAEQQTEIAEISSTAGDPFVTSLPFDARMLSFLVAFVGAGRLMLADGRRQAFIERMQFLYDHMLSVLLRGVIFACL
jgi:hypothetical protein